MKKNLIRALTIVLINSLTLILLMLTLGKHMQTENLYKWAALVSFGAIIQTASILLFYKYVDKKNWKNMNLELNKKDWGFSFIAIFSTISLFVIYLFIASRVDGFTVEWNMKQFSSIRFYLLLFCVGFAWFNAAFTEEVLFRWYLVSNLKKHLSTAKIYMATSIFFMLSHVFKGGFDPLYMLFLVTTSCSLLYVYLRTGGKILPVTFVHLAHNLAMNHLVGNSEMAILKINAEPSIIHLMVLTILYNILIIMLSTVMYKKHETLNANAGMKEPEALLV